MELMLYRMGELGVHSWYDDIGTEKVSPTVPVAVATTVPFRKITTSTLMPVAASEPTTVKLT